MQVFRFRCCCFLVVLILGFTFSASVSAQQAFFLFGHGVYSTPVDKNFKGNYNTGLGVEGGAAIGWNKTFIVGTIGYSNFSNENGVLGGNISYVPYKIGLRQYIFSKLLYIHGDLGAATIKNDNYNESRFSGDLGIGVKLGSFEAQLDYDGFSRSDPSGYASWIGIKAGFAFGL